MHNKKLLLTTIKILIHNQKLFALSLEALEQWLQQNPDIEAQLSAFRIREELEALNNNLELLATTNLEEVEDSRDL